MTVLNLMVRLLELLATLSALLLGITFTKAERIRYPLLGRLDGRQIHLFLIALGSLLLSIGISYISDRLEEFERKDEMTKILSEIDKLGVTRHTTVQR